MLHPTPPMSVEKLETDVLEFMITSHPMALKFSHVLHMKQTDVLVKTERSLKRMVVECQVQRQTLLVFLLGLQMPRRNTVLIRGMPSLIWIQQVLHLILRP